MTTRPFPIGFWNYVEAEMQDARAVQDWADAGMTLAMSPSYGPEADQVQRLRSILEAAHERQIQVILCDRRAAWRHLSQVGEDQYRQDFLQAVADLGREPAVFGFSVGDEPNVDEFADACRALELQRELAPHLTPFCNLLPWHGGSETRVGYASWAAYLDAYVEQGRPQLLCYDCYSQMNPGTGGWDMYFRNLREYWEAGQRHGLPFWTTVLSVGHFNYRCPREDDLRWQINTAAAHGARGILWFFFYMRRPHENYRVAPIDEHGERTETFAWLSRVNRTFLKGPAAVLQRLDLRRVSHVGQTWGGVAPFDGSGRVIRAHSGGGTPLVVSEFQEPGGAQYVAVVNNSQTDSTRADIWVGGQRPRLHRVGWQGPEELVTEELVTEDHGADFAVTRPWLAPGQMELLRVAP